MTHQYFVDKAERIFRRASGDPANAGALAAWAESVRPSKDSRLGVLVAEDGTLIAETRYNPGLPHQAGATYVARPLIDAAAELVNLEAGLALHAAIRITGQRVIQVTFSDVCTGPGIAVQPDHYL